METRSPKTPWYTPMYVRFLSHDVPRLLKLPQQLFARDVHTLEQRLANEGESFFTKTLPALGKAIDLALQGHTMLSTSSFKKRGRTALPAFLSALHSRVFKDDGWVRDDVCTDTVRLLRQICYWCKKLERNYSDESLQNACAKYESADAELPAVPDDLSGSRDHLDVARALVERIFRHVGRPTQALPKHGPGAVAGGGGTLGKRWFGERYPKLESVFRPIPWFFSLRDAAECHELITSRKTVSEAWGVLVFVPKDSSGPRSIVKMPAPYQWAQQALKGLIYDHIDNGRNLARGRINFKRQDVNRGLALNWREYDTTDLSEASDRNSYVLFVEMWRNTSLFKWLDASRTVGTILPGGKRLREKKFAPMGSAVCFPVMAVSFWALAVAALHLAGMPLFLACRKTYIYGDDLILPHGYFQEVKRVFEAVGLKFNASKCCVHGKFRESCGMDAYDGHDVSPVRMKSDAKDERISLVRLVKHTNRLMVSGYWEVALWMRREIKRHIRDGEFNVSLPITRRFDLPILTWHAAPWEQETLRVRLQDGISTVEGWYSKPIAVQSSDLLERFHLRESLCHGGPVGSLRNAEAHFSRARVPDAEDFGPRLTGTVPRLVRRTLSEKYSGDLLKGRFTIVREYESVVDVHRARARKGPRAEAVK